MGEREGVGEGRRLVQYQAGQANTRNGGADASTCYYVMKRAKRMRLEGETT